MKFGNVIALQLLQLSSHVANSAFLPSFHLAPRHLAPREQDRETQQSFDETTARYKQDGLYRHYLDSSNKQKAELGICVQKCGDLVVKDLEKDDTHGSAYTTDSNKLPEIIDPDSDRYTPVNISTKFLWLTK